MTDSIAAVPFWEITFDSEGDPDPGTRDTFLHEVAGRGVTDLFVFSHGWNNDRDTARRLYNGFLGLLARQLKASPGATPVTPGFAGVMWPSKRWSDEPIPDFSTSDVESGTGAASATASTTDVRLDPAIDGQTLTDLLDTFPSAKATLERMKSLLDGEPTSQAQQEFADCLKEFTDLAGVADSDGETEPGADPALPRMLTDDDRSLFERYAAELEDAGVDLSRPGDGTASLGGRLRGIWNGAKEAARQATYWQMKNRAGVVGQNGLGPLLGQLATTAPGIRVHLIGHSFGARLVSYALAGLPAGGTSPVASVTLLQGAFSHFAFAPALSFDPSRSGALARMETRIQGPLTVCFSRHDGAVGRFYPLASIAARDDTAAAHDRMFRWGGMGADGAQDSGAVLDVIQPAGATATYRFARNRILNIDTSEVVRRGGAPTGAHSDIVHPELTWIVLAASRHQ